MVTITRRLAAQLRPVLRRAQDNQRGSGPIVGFIAAKEGLTVKADCGDVIVEYRVPGTLAEETLWLPFDLLTDCEGKKDDPVELETSGDHQVTVRWQDRNGPQLISYDAVTPAGADKFPARLTDLAANPPRLLQAMADASEIADPDNTRYALGTCSSPARGAKSPPRMAANCSCRRVLLFPGRTICSSSVRSSWPLPNCPTSNRWRSARAATCVIGVGPWTFYLRVTEGRFPKVAQNIPDPNAAKSRCGLGRRHAVPG